MFALLAASAGVRGTCRIGVKWAFGPIDAGEDGLQRVVIGLRDRIELVIVAAGAMDRRAGEGRHDIGDHVVAIEQSGPCFLSIVSSTMLISELSSQGPAARNPKATVACGSSGIKHVAGHLLGDKAGVGLVVVERANQIIAIGPGVGPRAVLVVSVRFGKVHDVHPVPRPALAIKRAGQQPIDKPLVGGGRLIGRQMPRPPQAWEAVRSDRSRRGGSACGDPPAARETDDAVPGWPPQRRQSRF